MNYYTYWQEIETLMDEALDLQEELRLPHIKKKCSHNRTLLEEAIDYYKFIKKAADTSFLENEFVASSDLLGDPELARQDKDITEEFIGSTIGPYQICKLLGEGGMGAVFLAERIDGEFKQKVAIKFLRGGFFSPIMRKRFKNEKKILSRLNHPNIARLIDGGISDDGSPYLTMEFVDGLPINEYCNLNNLKIEDRLNLFIKVCKAVQFAHSKLIIHRDLKPENIFITKEGRVKVMDFGIAKFIHPDTDELSTIQTREGRVLASFQFAAPEQLQSEAPTIETDVYGLGALLYLLLTNEYPHKFDDYSFSQIESAILQEEPVRPGQLSKKEIGPISTDLEAIILKALRKEPQRRYSSVVMLTEDIKRYNKNLPVNAKPYSFGYRAGLIIRRHKKALAFFIFLVTGLLTLFFFHNLQLTQERDIAQFEAERAEAINDFLVGMVTETDPYESPGEPITVRTLLDQNVNEITSQFADQPEIALELLLIIGRGQTWLANQQQARATLNKGIELIEGDDIELDSAFLASYKYILSSTYTGVSERRDELLKQALDLIEGQPDKQLMRAGITKSLAHTAYVDGEYERSVELVQRAIDNACEPEALEIDPGWCTVILRDAFYYLRGGGKNNEALESAERQYHLSMELFDHGHPDQAEAGQVYANSLVYQHRPNDAIEIIRQSQEIVKSYDRSDNMRMLRLYTILAIAESAKGNDNKAIDILQRVLNQAMDLADDAFSRGPQINNMIDLLLNLKRAEEARLAYEKFGYKDPELMSHHHKWGHKYNEFRREILITPIEEVPQQRWLQVIKNFEENYDDWLPNLKVYALDHSILRQDLDSAHYWFERINNLDDSDIKNVRTAFLTLARYWLAKDDIEMADKILDRARILFEEREELQGPRIAKLNAIQAEISCREDEFSAGRELLQIAEYKWIQAEGHPDHIQALRQSAATCVNH